ncbi:Asp23/Gls24 family envelope stress response protein [Actinomadura sp. ATCC 31491]|uniref:Asp23/Gls24 family envelope stress response protein n=1 Tax=Actinomadura luzonensis TaxID=2805427 RepID=A0ABT0FKB0_9ACTN|nr:Asp23/Gls24 family envelope stress response protein [Actinomadura luzonensis]MCK2212739.1 Asp23/Gls24 family envelope stress response protein [Actinomadura luzonensis]
MTAAPGPAPALSPVAAERRGRTEVADRVVVKIACCAAEEVPDVRAVHVKGMPWEHASEAQVRGDRATVRMNVAVAYPAPLHAVAARLREHVTRRVAYQTGLTVDRLDIKVTDLESEGRP